MAISGEPDCVFEVYRYVSDGEVIYVGMGKPGRSEHHKKACFWKRRNPFYNKLRKILCEGREVCVEVMVVTHDRAVAQEKEKEFIALYRRRLEGGTLWNIADGGQGCQLTGEALLRRNEKIRQALINSPVVAKRRKPPKPKKAPRNLSVEERQALSARMAASNPMHNPAIVDKMRLSKTGKTASAETRRKMSSAHLGRKHAMITCPHCGKTGGSTAMPRWHFDNCMERKT